MNNSPSKFIIFANARTGSTSLAKLLDESPDVNLAMEPFSKDFTKWYPAEKNYSEFVEDTETMNSALDEIFSKYNAIKELQYRLPEELFIEMLKRRDIKIVFLTRDDKVAVAVSAAVAEQTDTWHKEDIKGDPYKDLEPISIAKLERHIKYITRLNEVYLDFLEKNRKGEFIHIVYEKLFSEDKVKNIETTRDICNFLGISMPPEEKIQKYLTPSNSKVGYGGLYKKVPNYEEIIEHFK